MRINAMIDEMLLEFGAIGGRFPGLQGKIRFFSSLGSFPEAQLTWRYRLIGRNGGFGFWILADGQKAILKGSDGIDISQVLRLDPSCLAKRLSCARSMSFLLVQSSGKGAAGHSVLRSNSRRVWGVSHCRDKLSQNQLGVLCPCCFSSFRDLAMGSGEGSSQYTAVIFDCGALKLSLNASLIYVARDLFQYF